MSLHFSLSCLKIEPPFLIIMFKDWASISHYHVKRLSIHFSLSCLKIEPPFLIIMFKDVLQVLPKQGSLLKLATEMLKGLHKWQFLFFCVQVILSMQYTMRMVNWFSTNFTIGRNKNKVMTLFMFCWNGWMKSNAQTVWLQYCKLF